jgi:hypothetical protein
MEQEIDNSSLDHGLWRTGRLVWMACRPSRRTTAIYAVKRSGDLALTRQRESAIIAGSCTQMVLRKDNAVEFRLKRLLWSVLFSARNTLLHLCRLDPSLLRWPFNQMLDRILKFFEAATYDFRETACPSDSMQHLFDEWVPYYRMKWAIARAIQPE